MIKMKCLPALVLFSCLSVHAQSGLDTTKWVVVDGAWIDRPNRDQICNLASAVAVADGVLTLTAKHETVLCKGGVDYGPSKKEWTGGTIYAKSFNFLYGSIEARIKSAGWGVHSGLLWMMGSGCQPIMYQHSYWCNHTWPNPNNEIDISLRGGKHAHK